MAQDTPWVPSLLAFKILLGLLGLLIVTFLILFFFFNKPYKAYSLVADEIQSKYFGKGVMSYTDNEATKVGVVPGDPKTYHVHVYLITDDGSTRPCFGVVVEDPVTKELKVKSASCSM